MIGVEKTGRIHQGCKDAAGHARPRHPPRSAPQALGKVATLARAHAHTPTLSLTGAPAVSCSLLDGLEPLSQEGGILRASPNRAFAGNQERSALFGIN